MFLLKDTTVTLARLKSAALRSRVKHSTTEPLCSHKPTDHPNIAERLLNAEGDINLKKINKIYVCFKNELFYKIGFDFYGWFDFYMGVLIFH